MVGAMFALGGVFFSVGADAWGQSSDAAPLTETGTVIRHDLTSVMLQVFDTATSEVVLHPYLMTEETRGDLVHAGDQVQVVYHLNGSSRVLNVIEILPTPVSSGTWTRASGNRAEAKPATVQDVPRATAKAAAVPKAVTVPAITRGTATSTTKRSTVADAKLPTQKPGQRDAKVSDARLEAAPIVRGAPVQAAPRDVSLGNSAKGVVPKATDVPLGIDAGYSKAAPVPVTRPVVHEAPLAACHASDEDWATLPLRIAVLDFRYPTDREEAHDIGRESGGSGMAVADLVYTRLGEIPEFAVDRGDHRRLDRSDIAGAARLGRALGDDAVLEGTFFPIQEASGSEGDGGKLRGYELHAGLVDTCTGQVLMKLSSVVCPNGDSNSKDCTHVMVTAREADDPTAHAAAFKRALDGLLDKLEHNGGFGTGGVAAASTAGVVVGAGVAVGLGADEVTMRMNAGISIRPGVEVAIHAKRLAKNPTTFTLQYLQGGEIGRVVVDRVSGTTVTGRYHGDIMPKGGDTVELVVY
jgi:hypothetical protein